MGDKALKRAVFQIVRYVPYLFTEEFVNIGVILYEVETENPQIAVRITRDWRRVHFMDPDAPIELLEKLEGSLLEIHRPGRFYETADLINEASSTGLRVSSQLAVTRAKAVLVSKTLNQELDSLISMYVDLRRQSAESAEEET